MSGDATRPDGGSRAFLVGATGLLGPGLARLLRDRGWRVAALARSHTSERALAPLGVEIVPGDLTVDGAWRDAAAAADLIIHAGLPRIAPPIRRRQIRRLAVRAADGARRLAAAAGGGRLVMASTALAGTDLALGRPAAAAEAAVHGADGAAVVRLGWVYGPSGPMSWVGRGLLAGRFRIVGPGTNRWPVISAPDAAEALLVAAGLGTGVHAAAEDEVPRQRELISEICAQAGAPMPDHVPEPLAGFSLGSALAAGLAADLRLEPASELRGAGWRPAHRWRVDFLPLTRDPEAPGEEAR